MSGESRRRVGETQEGVDRRGLRPGVNNDSRYLLVFITSISPDIIVTSSWKCSPYLMASERR